MLRTECEGQVIFRLQGIMVVEINRSSQYPVAIEMTQGCSLTDARLLFERIKSSATSSSHLDPVVVISP